MPPLLFILLVNDVYADLNNTDGLGEINDVNISQNCFLLLLFVDDMVLFSKDPVKLQLLFDKLFVYSSEWDLKVNTEKTKICVFENRKTQSSQVWSYNVEPLEIMELVCYLGRKFH